MKKSLLLSICLSTALMSSIQSYAQELKINPTGRILMDGALYDSKDKEFVSGVAIPDVRLGVKASYGDYKAKIDIGYSYGKVSLKDIFVERKFSQSSLVRLGYFVHQFGLQSATSSSMKITMDEPDSNEAFFNSRLIGAMYIHDKGAFFGTASAFIENEAIKKSSNEMGKQGYGFMSRLVYRPFRDPGKIFHVGISGAYETPRYNSNEELNHKSFELSANFPTRVAKVNAVDAVVTDAKRLFKFTPELLVGHGPMALEAQYYNVNIFRDKGFNNYHASGAYALIRGLVLGGNYIYSGSDSGIATPKPGSLELVGCYNYTEASDDKAEIRGGRLNDVSFTANYYINKYMIWRLRYSYTKVTNKAEAADVSLNAFQTRFQIIF